MLKLQPMQFNEYVNISQVLTVGLLSSTSSLCFIIAHFNVAAPIGIPIIVVYFVGMSIAGYVIALEKNKSRERILPLNYTPL